MEFLDNVIANCTLDTIGTTEAKSKAENLAKRIDLGIVSPSRIAEDLHEIIVCLFNSCGATSRVINRAFTWTRVPPDFTHDMMFVFESIARRCELAKLDYPEPVTYFNGEEYINCAIVHINLWHDETIEVIVQIG